MTLPNYECKYLLPIASVGGEGGGRSRITSRVNNFRHTARV